MNMFKKNGGFTLVELIVVIAILAILAGVAVPAYTGYIKKAEQAGDLQALASVNTAVQGVAIGEGAEVTKIVVDKDGKLTITADEAGDSTTAVTIDVNDVTALTGKVTYSKAFAGATWEKGEWELTEATTATDPSEG